MRIITALGWLHMHITLVSRHQKENGNQADGHERAGIIDYEQKSLRKMITDGFLNKYNLSLTSTKYAI